MDSVEEKIFNFLPKIDNTNNLLPNPLFISNLNVYPFIEVSIGQEIVFIQPLLITQNQFESDLINKWNGQFKIDENNNYILTAMVGAGIKNDDNSFSGVLMGDIQGKTGFAESGLGLYGFHRGGQSFGFNIDGTAFLGKSGSGRIEFDGNNSLIKSASWDGDIDDDGKITLPGNQGMAISLKTGHIDAHTFKLTSENIKLNSGNFVNENNPYLFVGNKNSFIEFTSTGGLNIKVTSFSLTSANALDETVIGALDGTFVSGEELETELNRENTLNRLVQYGDGIYFLEDGKLYIVADAIATGYLRSKQKINGIPKMTIDMDTGHIDAYNFKLTGGDSLYLNSNPDDYYFKIEHKNNYLQFTKDGALQINVEGDNSYFKAKNFNLDVDSDIDLILNINTEYWSSAIGNFDKLYSSIDYQVEANVCLQIGINSVNYTNCNEVYGGGWSFVPKNWKTFLGKIKNNNDAMVHTKKIWKSIYGTDLPTDVLTEENKITENGWKVITSTVYNITNWENNIVDSSDSRIILRLASELSDLSAKYLKIKFDKTGLFIYRYLTESNEIKNIRNIFEVSSAGVSAFMSNISLSNETYGEALPSSNDTGMVFKDGTLFFLLEEIE